MLESKRERGSDSGEGDSRAENRRKRKVSSFGVESKVFEVEIKEKRGKPQAIIVESKRGVVMDPSGAGKRRVFSRGSGTVPQGWERR